jgi:hypothetical protein
VTPYKPGAIWVFVLVTEGELASQPSLELLVVCLCAQWCGVCNEYRARFDAVQLAISAHWPNTRFLWVDVEDEADVLYPLDVEDFPTLLIASGDSPCFFGPLTPQAQTLERMVRSIAQEPAEHHLADGELRAAVSRLRGLGC